MSSDIHQKLKKGVDYIGVCICFFCHDGQGNFLMGKRSFNTRDEHGTWDTGGGGLKFGEAVEETLAREIKEEYGTDIIAHEFLGYRDVHREKDGSPSHWVALDFKVHIDPEKVYNAEPDMIEDVSWFTWETLPAPLHSQIPKFLETYREKLAKF